MEVSYLPDLLSIAPPPFIYIHDPLSLLPFHPADKLLGKLTIQIDCNECITSRILFTRIVNGLAKWCPTWADGCESWGGSDGYGAWDASWDSFVHALRGVVLKDDIKGKGKAKADDDDDGRGEPFILLFKNAEKFSEVLPALFAPLTRLAELVSLKLAIKALEFLIDFFIIPPKANLNASVIFVSHYTWMDLRPGWGASPEPLVIAVPPLNTDQITAYLVSLFPLSRSPSEITPYNPTLHSIYKGYVRILYDACSSATQDPRQLAYIAAARWPGYIAPLLQDWKHIDSDRMDDEEDIEYPLPSENDQLRLVVLFKSTFTIALDALQPRLSHARAWANEHAPPETVRLSDPSTGAVLNTGKRAKSHGITPLLAVLLDLPIHTQIILVASYLASHNPAKTDIRMFGRASDGGKKKSKRKGGVRKTKPGVVVKVK